MKKIIFLFSMGVFSLLASLSMAQSLQVHDLEGNNVSGSVINVWGDSAYVTLMEAPFDVKNISAGTVYVKVKKTEISLQPGSSNTFCFNGYCYLSTVYVSPTAATIAAGAKDTTFSGDYRPKGTLGASIIMYVFFRTDDPNDSAFVIVQFNATPAGLELHSSESLEISNPYPNPASSHTSFNYSFPENSSASFTLSDITGNIIKEIPVYNTQGVLEVSTNDVSEGMYFYSFYIDGKMLMTKKLIIQR
ncbi:MAG: T9SS type A sorting domain-containing protein [Bacteroidota bacterium]